MRGQFTKGHPLISIKRNAELSMSANERFFSPLSLRIVFLITSKLSTIIVKQNVHFFE